MTEDYIYDDLVPGRQQIRLLRIQNDKTPTVPSFSLTIFDFKTVPKYQALSYTWGNPRDMNSILLNDQHFVVRKNLFHLLKLYHFRQCEQYIWIDQICINQDNIEERNKQVQFMSDIYRKAEDVLIWLGLGTSRNKQGSLWVQDVMKDLRANPELPDQTPAPINDVGFWSSLRDPNQPKRIFQGPTGKCRLRRVGSGGHLLSNHDPLLTEDLRKIREGFLKGLTRNGYWSRLWIVQEVILARQRRVWYDEIQFDWQDLVNLCKYVERLQRGPSDMESQLKWLTTGFDRADRSADGTMLPHELIHNFCDSKAQDPRDKYYALQGLFSEDYRVAVDYAASPASILVDVGVSVVDNYGFWVIEQLAANMNVHAQQMFLSEGVDTVEEQIANLLRGYRQHGGSDRAKILRAQLMCLEDIYKRASEDLEKEQGLNVLREAYEIILVGASSSKYSYYIGPTAKITESSYQTAAALNALRPPTPSPTLIESISGGIRELKDIFQDEHGNMRPLGGWPDFGFD